MIEKLRSCFHQIYLIFNNFVIALSIPIIFALSLASGYTTFHGMNIFVPSQWIAAIITFAVQAVIIIASIELGRTHIRANVMRFGGLLASLLIGLTVSMFFSYFTFFENSEAANTKERKFNQLNSAINEYFDKAWESKTRLILQKEEEIGQVKKEVDDAFWGRSNDLPQKMRKPGKGRLYKYYKEKQDREEAGLASLKEQFLEIREKERELRRSLAELSMINVGKPSEYGKATQPVYDKIRRQFAALTGMFEHVFSNNGLAPVKQPELMPHDIYVKMTPTLDDISENPLSALPLSLAIVIDVLTFVLSYRLQVVPMGTLVEKQKQFVYNYLKEFSKWHINKNDQLEFGIEKSEAEESSGYNDGPRKFAAATLLNLGFIRRVKKNSAEFTSFFYPIVMEEIIDEHKSAQKISTSDVKKKGAASEDPSRTSRKAEKWSFGQPDLQVVYRKSLFSRKYMERPPRLRFYDRVIHLNVDRFRTQGEHSLFGGLIVLEFRLNVFFQATPDYVRNAFGKSFVPNVNENIKEKYKEVLRQTAISVLKQVESDMKKAGGKIEPLYDTEKIGTDIEKEATACMAASLITCSADCELSLSFRKDQGSGFVYKDVYEHVERLEKDFEKDREQKEKKLTYEAKREERDFDLEDKRHDLAILEAESEQNSRRRELLLKEQQAKYEFEKEMRRMETDHKIFFEKEARREEEEKKRGEMKDKVEVISAKDKFRDNKIEMLGKGKSKKKAVGEK